jgi:hypothetical protein
MKFLSRRCAGLLLIALFVGGNAAAESSMRQGDLVVHYNAVPSISLAPEVARQYAITRSANRALLNIAVMRRQTDGTDKAIAATLAGSATNLAGQRQELSFRQVREGDAIYYLAEPRVTDRETLAFDVQVTAEGETAPLAVRFRQEFFPPLNR